MERTKNRLFLKNAFAAGACIRRLTLAWLAAAAVQYGFLPEELRALDTLDGVAEMSFGRLVALAAAAFCMFLMLAFRFHTAAVERWGIVVSFAVLAGISLRASFAIPFLFGCLLLLLVLGVYAWRGWNGEEEAAIRVTEKKRAGILLAAGFAGLFFLFVSIWTVCRVLTFCAPTYDFGIFSQMFYQMRTTGFPTTTLERDGLLSHFCVHVSPIYYLLLPFYWAVPMPATLQVLQAAVLASAVIPMWKLAQRHGFSGVVSGLFCLLLLLYPAYSGGAGYDIHENAFLTPLLLWLFYAIDCHCGWMTALFSVLTLIVKEDAAVYVAVVAIWLVLRSILRTGPERRWGLIAGSVVFAGAVAWFLAVTSYLARYGDGVMTYRYQNFMYGGSTSLVTVIQTVFLSPVKALYECVDPEKLGFLGLTLLPLCGLPLLTRRYERLVLLIPYLLVNLMSDYQYQHDIFFQYTYGATACLFYMTVVNFEDIAGRLRSGKKIWKVSPLILTLVISAACFGAVVVPRAVQYPGLYLKNREYYAQLTDFLSQVPDDASVTATTFYTVPLSGRELLYDVRYSSGEHLLSTEYIVLGVSDADSYAAYAADAEKKNGFAGLIDLLERNGYTLLDELEGSVVIYRKNGQ